MSACWLSAASSPTSSGLLWAYPGSDTGRFLRRHGSFNGCGELLVHWALGHGSRVVVTRDGVVSGQLEQLGLGADRKDSWARHTDSFGNLVHCRGHVSLREEQLEGRHHDLTPSPFCKLGP